MRLDSITLRDFSEETKADLERFTEWWLEQGRKNPARFPFEMSPGDWFEQFLIFLTTPPDDAEPEEAQP